MSTPEGIDSPARHEFVAQKRELIVRRLAHILSALNQKRHAVTDVARDVAALLPHPSSTGVALAEPAGARVRSVLLGAVVGGAVFALGLLIERQRRERNKPLRLVQRAWFKYAMPPRPSLIRRVVTDALGSLLMSVAEQAARVGVQRLLEASPAVDDEPEDLARESYAPESDAAASTATVDPGETPPREARLPPSEIIPPAPIAPLPSPMRLLV